MHLYKKKVFYLTYTTYLKTNSEHSFQLHRFQNAKYDTNKDLSANKRIEQ